MTPRIALALVLAGVTACGYPPLDAGGHTDAPKPLTDGKPGTCDAKPNYGPSFVTQAAEYETHADDVLFSGRLTSGTTPDFFGLADGGATFPQGFGPATINLASETQGKTCDVCVDLQVKCSGCNFDTGTPAADYWAQSGTLNITTLTQTMIVGTLQNAVFAHVTVNANDGTTTLVNDGCTTTIASASISASITSVNQ
jgi:hypothetical protein